MAVGVALTNALVWRVADAAGWSAGQYALIIWAEVVAMTSMGLAAMAAAGARGKLRFGTGAGAAGLFALFLLLGQIGLLGMVLEGFFGIRDYGSSGITIWQLGDALTPGLWVEGWWIWVGVGTLQGAGLAALPVLRGQPAMAAGQLFKLVFVLLLAAAGTLGTAGMMAVFRAPTLMELAVLRTLIGVGMGWLALRVFSRPR